ncbi:MAG: pilus assembly protein TadG-related protein [Nocardioides sp.]|uniref:pilus assembly protein TadG-related protein n=1 Tax=Nocardioides sp. TaxID=35761 RepID=UPI0039E274C3
MSTDGGATGDPTGERGSTIPLIVGFVVVLALLVAVVVDVSAAYLRRQSLDTLADGAALTAADLGASGSELYDGGLARGDRLRLTSATARRAVADYLRRTGAYGRYPGLRLGAVRVRAGTREVEVELSSRVALPLRFPGAAGSTRVGATGTASVTLDTS